MGYADGNFVYIEADEPAPDVGDDDGIDYIGLKVLMSYESGSGLGTHYIYESMSTDDPAFAHCTCPAGRRNDPTPCRHLRDFQRRTNDESRQRAILLVARDRLRGELVAVAESLALVEDQLDANTARTAISG